VTQLITAPRTDVQESHLQSTGGRWLFHFRLRHFEKYCVSIGEGLKVPDTLTESPVYTQ